MTNFLRFFTLLIAISLGGCGATLPKIKPYKMDIQQGNVVTSKMLLKLRPGMTKSQVKFIMGTPLLVDSFRTNRWDYFYQLRKQGKIVSQRRVILDFDDDLLKQVRGDVVPKGKTVEDVTNQLKEEAGVAPEALAEEELVEPSGLVVTPLEDPVAEVVDQEAVAVDDASASVLAVPAVVEPLAAEAVGAVETPSAPDAKAVEKESIVPDEVPTPVVAKEELAPLTSEPVVEPKTKAMKEVDAPVSEEVDVMEPVVTEQKPAVLNVVPSKANANKKVFRLDHSLDTTRIIPVEVSESKAALQESVVKEVDEEVVEQDDPSFFERALEKIGF